MSLAEDPQVSSNGRGTEVVLRFEDVHLAFEENVVLDGVSFELRRGETKILFGVAGSGKSTILKLALGLLKPDSGRIEVLGVDVVNATDTELFELRRVVGMVFQESALFDSLNVEENVTFRLQEEHTPEDEMRSRAKEVLRFVELEHTLAKFPAQLSGGMRRRVGIARAIITHPEIILYDSPTGGLDPITSTTIVELIIKQRDLAHTSALLVTHRLQDAFVMATHRFDQAENKMVPLEKGQASHTTFIILREGHIIFDGTAPQLRTSKDEYIKEYIS